MSPGDSTCWILVQGAAAGSSRDREEFARRYAPVVRAYLGERWRGTPWIGDLEDAVQEVFVDCFRDDGLLERVDRSRSGGFRAFLYGAVRLVALRFERQAARRRERHRSEHAVEEIPGDDATLSSVFDRAWAGVLLKEARQLQQARAAATGEGARRRVELLRLRFAEDLPIREIARRWGCDAADLHREYARARREFREALLEVVSAHCEGTRGEVERQCTEILELVQG